MSREERKNMIEFIAKTKGTEKIQMAYMTDDEIEHIYNSTYSSLEAACEC
ncbi:MAG: BH0509 family protein [Bacillaceae bacterium]